MIYCCRLLVSFCGEYLSHKSSVSSSCSKTEEDSSSSDHQLLKISVPQTQLDLFGPAFIEVKLTFSMLYDVIQEPPLTQVSWFDIMYSLHFSIIVAFLRNLCLYYLSLQKINILCQTLLETKVG